MLAFACALALLLAVAGSPAHAEGEAPQPQAAAALPDEPYRAALAPLALTPADLRLDADLIRGFGQDRFRLPLFDLLASDAKRAPGVAVALREHALEAAEKPSEAILFAGTRIQARVRRALLGDPIADLAAEAAQPSSLADALVAIRRAEKAGDAAPAEVFAMRQASTGIPPQVAEAAALILLAEARFVTWRDRAWKDVAVREQESLALLSGFFVAQGEREEGARVWPVLEGVAARVEWAALAAGAFDTALAVERALPALRSASAAIREGRMAPFSFAMATPLGLVEIDGSPGSATRTADTPPLLSIDLCGDDRYATGAASRGPKGPVSILIDVDGDDVYEPLDPGIGHAFGSGVLGFALLVDAAGNDRYAGAHLALGAGFFGIGVLCDLAGDDVYEGGTYVQGAAAFGCGVLADAAGNDRYRCLDRSQGMGGVLGAGLLTDGAGNDTYTADDTEIRRPSPQSREHNTSMAQGAASGFRADYTDGRSYAGGFGMLADGGGDDEYAAGVFAQGTAYWYGVGILADRAGRDRYRAAWYAQGAAAHFAAGILHDEAGDDGYETLLNAGAGCGHDFSLGFLYDGAGDDTYRAPTLSLGAGNACGVGIFVDRAGRDTYAPLPGATTLFGEARTAPSKPYDLRRWTRTLGLFLDLGGATDAYPEGPRAGNGRAWAAPLEGDVPDDLQARGALGAGLDR